MIKFYQIGDYLIVTYDNTITVLNTVTKVNVSCDIADRLNLNNNTRIKRITDQRKNVLNKVTEFLTLETMQPIINY